MSMYEGKITLGVTGVLPEPRFSGKLRVARRSSLKAISKDDIRLEGRAI